MTDLNIRTFDRGDSMCSAQAGMSIFSYAVWMLRTGLRRTMKAPGDRTLGIWVAGFTLLTRIIHMAGYLAGEHTGLYYWPVLASTKFEEAALAVLAGSPAPGPFVYSSPLYQYLMVPFYAAGAGRMGLFVMQSLLAPLTVWLLYHTARRIGASRAPATAAALLWSLYAPAAFLELTLLPTAVMTLLVTLFTRLQLSGDGHGRRSGGTALLSGLITGILSGFRPPMLILYAIPAFRWIRTRRILLLAVGVAGLLVPLLFLSLQQREAGGDFYPFPKSGGLTLVLGHNPDATGYGPPAPSLGLVENGLEDIHEVGARVAREHGLLTPGAADAYWSGIALDFMIHHPVRELELLGIKYAGFFGQQSFDSYYALGRVSTFNPVLPFFFVPRWLICGLFLMALIPFCLRGGGRITLLLPVALSIGTSVLLVHSERFFLPALPLMLAIASTGLGYLYGILRSHPWKGAVVVAAGAALMVPTFIWPVPDVPEDMFLSSLAVRAYNMRDYPLSLELFERTAVISEPGTFTWDQAHREAAIIARALGDPARAAEHEALLNDRRL